MLISKTGTVTLKNVVLIEKMSSEEVLSKYADRFRSFLFSSGDGVLRSSKPISDGQDHKFRVILNFHKGKLAGVVLYPILETLDEDTCAGAKEAAALRSSFCNDILRDLFGEPNVKVESGVTYKFETCSVLAWTGICMKDMCSGGCIVVDYTPPSEPPRPVFKCVREDVSDKC